MASYRLNHYANHIKRKRKQFTKQGERYVRRRPGSTAATMPAEREQSEKQQFYAIFAEKEKKKMTHSKQTT